MKLTQKVFLSSLSALLFTASVNANSQPQAELNVEQQINQQLRSALIDINKPDVKVQMQKQLNKLQLELHTGLLVANAKETVPTNQLKVVIGE